MTYSRAMTDSMMVESTASTNGNHNDAVWTGNSERTEHQNGDEEGHENRQLSDSPISNGASHATGGNPPICQNCGTSTTPLWRRNELGATLCNACGLFLKLHGRARPLNLKTDTIKSRNRVKSVNQPKKKMVFDGPDHKMHTSPRSKHMNGHTNGYSNGHLRIEQHPKHRPDMGRPMYDHHDSAYSSQGYSYARSTASSTESGPEYSPPTGSLSEPVKPYSPFYGSVNSPRDYTRGAHTPPYYPSHTHHPLTGPPPLALPPPTSHADGSRALPPPASLLRPSPPPRHDSPQLPPIYAMDQGRHLAPHHPHSPLVPGKRDTPDHLFTEQLESLKQSNEQLRGRVMELELVNDLMKSRVAELESSEQKARSTIDSLKSDLAEYQSRENELYRKIDKLKDELVDTYKVRHSRSPSSSSRSGDNPEESASKRRKVLVSDLVDEKSQQPVEQPTSTPTVLASNGVEIKSL